MEVRFLDAGDCAVTVEFGDTIERALSERVLRLGARVREQLPPGVIEAVPTFRSLMVHYDPLATDRASVVAHLETLLDDGAAVQASATLWRIPACYEGDYAPDLDDVAARTGLTPRDVARLHADTLFHVYMIGFVPGYPYMGDLPAQLVLPRRADPRVRVPPGSIAIASTMTAIYPLESPGGWHLIGTTPVRLFDAASASPSLLRPGDKVRFEPVPAAQFAEIGAAVSAGAYVVPHEEFTS